MQTKNQLVSCERQFAAPCASFQNVLPWPTRHCLREFSVPYWAVSFWRRNLQAGDMLSRVDNVVLWDAANCYACLTRLVRNRPWISVDNAGNWNSLTEMFEDLCWDLIIKVSHWWRTLCRNSRILTIWCLMRLQENDFQEQGSSFLTNIVNLWHITGSAVKKTIDGPVEAFARSRPSVKPDKECEWNCWELHGVPERYEE